MRTRLAYIETLFAMIESEPLDAIIAFLHMLRNYADLREILRTRNKDKHNAVQAALAAHKSAVVHKLLNYMQDDLAELFKADIKFEPIMLTALRNMADDGVINRLIDSVLKSELDDKLLFTVDVEGVTPLMDAAKFSRLEILKRLLEIANKFPSLYLLCINKVSQSGTALSVACQKEETELNNQIIITLIEHHADLLLAHDENHRPIDLFAQFTRERLVNIFIALSKSKQAYVLRTFRYYELFQNMPGNLCHELSFYYNLQTYTLLDIEKKFGTRVLREKMDFLGHPKTELFEMLPLGDIPPKQLDLHRVKYNDLLEIKEILGRLNVLITELKERSDLPLSHVIFGVMISAMTAYHGLPYIARFALGVADACLGKGWYKLLISLANIVFLDVSGFVAATACFVNPRYIFANEWSIVRRRMWKIAVKLQCLDEDEREKNKLNAGHTYNPLSPATYSAFISHLKALRPAYLPNYKLEYSIEQLIKIFQHMDAKMYSQGTSHSIFHDPSYENKNFDLLDVNIKGSHRFITDSKPKPLLKQLSITKPSITAKQMAFSIFGQTRPKYHNDPAVKPRNVSGIREIICKARQQSLFLK